MSDGTVVSREDQRRLQEGGKGMKRYHNADGGELEQVDISWIGGAPNPIYRCKICGARLDATKHEETRASNEEVLD